MSACASETPVYVSSLCFTLLSNISYKHTYNFFYQQKSGVYNMNAAGITGIV